MQYINFGVNTMIFDALTIYGFVFAFFAGVFVLTCAFKCKT